AKVGELLKQARRENRPLVLVFSGNFCPASTRLDEQTLANPRVRAALEHVIFHKIKVEEDRAAAHQFGIHGIPQLRFLSPAGDIVAEDKGVISVQRMLDHLAKLAQ
ncbi:MAG: thioredoxin family protein, partial [Planctomycetota bacterium]